MAESDRDILHPDKSQWGNENEEIYELKQQLEQRNKELEFSKLEANALKFVNAKLLTQLQFERQNKSESNSLSSTPLAALASSVSSLAATQPSSSKKKKKKNSTSEPSLTSENDESRISEEKIVNSTVQELMIHLQMENQKLSSDIIVLEEEVLLLPHFPLILFW
jgi:hypothetical protein